MAVQKTMDKLVALCKNRGFIFPGSDIYGGLANSWDYGPLGAQLKNSVKQAWWKRFVQERMDVVGLDSAILMNPRVWEASGHIGNFTDPLIDCKECRHRFRADNLIEDHLNKLREEGQDIEEIVLDGQSDQFLNEIIEKYNVTCPECSKHNFTSVRRFNMMYKTHQGVTEDSSTEIYLRPETAQGIFVNFRNVQRAMRLKVPFGIAQVGKSFRNEITPGNFTFRTREFEQMEMQYFTEPEKSKEAFEFWKTYAISFLKDLGLKDEELRIRDHRPEELSFYSEATSDIEFLFPFGWGELWGIASRTDYDLSRHQEYSKQDLSYFDPATNQKYIPYDIEPSLGADRLTLALLASAYDEEELENGETRTVLHFHPFLAPIKIAILPLSSKLADRCDDIFRRLSRKYFCEIDTRQSIGKRYRRQDEIGTPYCITYDFESDEDKMVTIRERDSMKQVRIPIDELETYFEGKFDF